MSRTTLTKAHDDADSSPVDSGWSTVPPPGSDATLALAEVPSEREPPTTRFERSGARPLPGSGRAYGTLLGVAPPVVPAISASSVHSPVFVRSGTAPEQSAIAKALPVPPAPPAPKRSSSVRPPPVLAVEVETDAVVPVASPPPSLIAPVREPSHALT